MIFLASKQCILQNTFSEDEKELLNRNRTEVVFRKNELISKQGSLATQLIFNELPRRKQTGYQ